jgi:putative Holliday junction resolvase
MARILAVDWGERRIGLAISDPEGILASGLPTLEVKARDQAIERIARVAVEEEASAIVVGLPLLLSGEQGEAARSALAFADALAEKVSVPVNTYDERLTSALSVRRLREAGHRTAGRKPKIDQGAAVALLESYLQRLRSEARRERGET